MKQKNIEGILMGGILASLVTNILMQQFYLDRNMMLDMDICYQCMNALEYAVYEGKAILSLQAPSLIVMIFVLAIGKKAWKYVVIAGGVVLNLKDSIRLVTTYLKVPSLENHEVQTSAIKTFFERMSVQYSMNLVTGFVVNILYVSIVVICVLGFINQMKGERDYEK